MSNFHLYLSCAGVVKYVHMRKVCRISVWHCKAIYYWGSRKAIFYILCWKLNWSVPDIHGLSVCVCVLIILCIRTFQNLQSQCIHNVFRFDENLYYFVQCDSNYTSHLHLVWNITSAILIALNLNSIVFSNIKTKHSLRQFSTTVKPSVWVKVL